MALSTGIQGVDHAAILVRDLAATEADYTRLGFRLTPIGRHNNTGTANHCIMFADDFFEVLAITAPTAFNKQWADMIDEHEGLRAIAFASDDVPATYMALKTAGFSPTEPKEFSRPVDLGGTVSQARFTLAYLEPDAVEGIRLFVCQHHTPDLVWRPEYLGHPNTATALARVTLAVDDPAAAAPAYGRIFGTTPKPALGGMDISAGRVTVSLISPRHAEAEFAGDPVIRYRRPVPLCLGFSVADREAARAVLGDSGVPYAETASGALRVPSAHASGVALDFA